LRSTLETPGKIDILIAKRSIHDESPDRVFTHGRRNGRLTRSGNDSMSIKAFARLLQCIAVVAAAAVSTVVAAQQVPAPAGQSSVPYLTGGTDQDELAQLMEQAATYNVKILLAERNGAYITGVKVSVTGSGGKPVLQVASVGPLLFARLPAGTYEVTATHEGVSQVRRLSVGAKGRSEMALRW
jgi:hypothetical protein